MSGGEALLTSPSRRRQKVEHVCDVLGVLERRACCLIGQPRSTHRRTPRTAEDDDRLAATYGRYGHRRITELLGLWINIRQ